MVPRTPAIYEQHKDRGNSKEEESGGGERKEEQRVGPSSSASRDAAASRYLSDGSQPPLGTVKVPECQNQVEWEDTRRKKIIIKKDDMTHKPNYLTVYDLLLGELCQRPLQ